MNLDKQDFRNYLETSESSVIGLGNFRLETHGVLAVWLASQGLVNVLVHRDEIIYKVRENSGVFLVLDMQEWMKAWIAYEDAFLFFSRDITGEQALEILDKLPD